MPKYAIVEFDADKDLAVVSSSWMYEDDGKTFCYCPPIAQMSRAAEKCLAVQLSWKAYKCRQLYCTGTRFCKLPYAHLTHMFMKFKYHLHVFFSLSLFL